MHVSPDQAKHLLSHHNQEYLQFKRALDIFGDKWSALIVICILEQPKRFSDIENFTRGISPRTLTQRLQSLEEFGLITKKEFKEFPPRTEYSVTQKARDLKAAMFELKIWAKKYCKQSSDHSHKAQ